MNQTMTSTSTNPCSASRPALAMPTGGQSCFGPSPTRHARIPATGLFPIFETTTGTEIRDRKDLAAKGHVAFAAYVPGYPAWSPPIC